MDFEEYTKTLDSIGESILTWADPERDFRGYTEVRLVVWSFLKKPGPKSNDAGG